MYPWWIQKPLTLVTGGICSIAKHHTFGFTLSSFIQHCFNLSLELVTVQMSPGAHFYMSLSKKDVGQLDFVQVFLLLPGLCVVSSVGLKALLDQYGV